MNKSPNIRIKYIPLKERKELLFTESGFTFKKIPYIVYLPVESKSPS